MAPHARSLLRICTGTVGPASAGLGRLKSALQRRKVPAALILSFGTAAALAACPPGTVVRKGDLLLAYRPVLAGKTDRIPMAQHFALEVQLCDRGEVSAASLHKADATMPEHRHGMNYRPAITPLGGGRFRVEGMMLHMAGHWQLSFEVQAGKEKFSSPMTCRSIEPMLKRLGLVALLSVAATTFAGVDKPEFTAAELERIAAHGPWPLPWTVDPGNRVSGNAAAIRLGYALFFEPRLSANRRVACASCHDPARGFQDGRNTGRGLVTGMRNTPGLYNVRHQRWFGWDGGHDNLWSASLPPSPIRARWAARPRAWRACCGEKWSSIVTTGRPSASRHMPAIPIC